MSSNCTAEFEQRMDTVGQRLNLNIVKPRQAIMLSRMQFMIYKKLNELMNHNLLPYGINDTIWVALVMLYSSPENYIYPSDLSHVIVSSRTNVTRLADEMVERGWVSRQGCETDRRKIILALTPAGIQLVESIIPLQWKLYETIWQDFSDTEKNLFEQLEHRLIDRLTLLLDGLPKHSHDDHLAHDKL